MKFFKADQPMEMSHVCYCFNAILINKPMKWQLLLQQKMSISFIYCLIAIIWEDFLRS